MTGVHRSSYDGYVTEHDDYATLGGITPAPSSTGIIVHPRIGAGTTSIHGSPIQKDTMNVEGAMSSSSHPIIGESATVFTDMTDTILKVLDRQMAVTAQAWEIENYLAENALAIRQPRQNTTGYMRDTNPDWFLPVTGNPRISKVFYGYSDSLSLDHNPMVLVELKEFIQWYGTPICAIDRVNGKMYHTFKEGYKLINEKAMLQPQYSLPTSLGSESVITQPSYMNTLPGTTSMGITMAESTPVPQVGPTLFRPIPMPHMHDILDPSANKQAKADYLEKQMKHMSSVQLLLSLPPSRDDIPLEDEGLPRRIQDYCSRIEDHRRCEKDTHHVTLNSIKEYKVRQQEQRSQKERDEAYKGMSRNLEKVREVTRSTLSRASTISTEECQMALTETDFITIKEKMNKIDQRLDGLYQNWQAEYKEAITEEQCEEIQQFYEPYVSKYETKYKILYQMLRQASQEWARVSPTWVPLTRMTPSLADLDDAPALKHKEWNRDEPSEKISQMYSTMDGHLTPTAPVYEDMRIDTPLNVTTEEWPSDLPAAIGGIEERDIILPIQDDTRGPISNATPPSTEVLETSPKVINTISDQENSSRRNTITRETSRDDALAATRCFFNTVNERRNVPEVPETSTTGVSQIDTSPVPPDPIETEPAEPGTASPWVNLPSGSPPRPTWQLLVDPIHGFNVYQRDKL